ncbi:hypothetical protein OCA08_20015 [Bacillus cereus]|nr:hypothetical protein [Bacillus cereus]
MEHANGIALANGETVIRKYEATQLDDPKTTGYLIATNRRLIFSGEAKGISGESVIVKDVQIDRVTGIHAFMGAGKSFAQIFSVVIITIIILLLSQISEMLYIALLFPAYTVYKLISNPWKNSVMNMVVMADNQTPSSINIAATASSGSLLAGLFSKRGTFHGDHAWLSVAAGPGKDTIVMIKELGALVLDIQAQGEHAIKNWEKPVKQNKEVYRTPPKSSPQTNENTKVCVECKKSYGENEQFCGECGGELTISKSESRLQRTQNVTKDEEFFS